MDRCDIIITAYRLNAVQPAAKALQRILGLSPADAAALAKRFPCVVRANEDPQEAERLCAALQEAGAFAELQAHESQHAPPEPAPEHQSLQVATSIPTRDEPPSGYVIGDLTIDKSAPAPLAARAARTSLAQPAPITPPITPARAAPAATAEAAVSGNVQMLDDGFGGEADHGVALELDLNATGKPLDQATASAMEVVQGPSGFDDEEQEAAALELDYGTAPKGTGKVEAKKPKTQATTAAKQSTPKAAPADKSQGETAAATPATGHKYAIHGAQPEGARRGQINVRDKGGNHGILGRLRSGSAAQLWVSACLAAVIGGAAYKVYALNEEDAVIRAQALRSMQAEVNDNSIDHRPGVPGKVEPPPAIEKDELTAKAPADVASPAIMERSVASERRGRMHGIHKVSVTWPAGAARDDTECMLLDTKYANKMDELASTGLRIDMPPAVEKQLKSEADALQASKRYRDRSFLPICLANR